MSDGQPFKHVMRKLFPLALITLCFLPIAINPLVAQPSHPLRNPEAVDCKHCWLYIYYDKRYPNAWIDKHDSYLMLNYLRYVLEAFRINYTIVNADELREVILSENPSRSILVLLQDVAPDTVWDGTSCSPIVRWLRRGAKVVWTGDWEFYYVGYRNGTKTHMEGIENVPFGRPVTKPLQRGIRISPSEAGVQCIPSLKGFLTLRPFSESLLQGLEYEAYGHSYVEGVRVIDPGLVKVGDGYFVKIGAAGGEISPVDRALYIAEFLLNRFYGIRADLTRGLSSFHPYDSGIVYILPYGASTPYWKKTYGDRIYFYAYANISDYKDYILSDLEVIARKYRFIILIIPLEDTRLFYYNLRQMDAWAGERGIKILYAIFPKWKYGPEWGYLRIKSKEHNLMIHNMEFLSNLRSTLAIAIWYGWEGRPMVPIEVEDFYNSLPWRLKKKYYIWIDEPFIENAVKAGMVDLANKLNLTVVTELYSRIKLSLYGTVFERQIIVTGYENAATADEWTTSMKKKLDYVLMMDGHLQRRKLAIWIFWDVNDGHGEKYRAYINNRLNNPLLRRLPQYILMDRAEPIEARVDVGSSQAVRLHFSWPDEFSASDINVVLNGTSHMTDVNGWIELKVRERNARRYVWIPTAARWGAKNLEVKLKVAPPSIIWDRIRIVESGAVESIVDTGSSTTVWFKAIYEYDSTVFDFGKGTLYINGSAASWNEAERRWELSTRVSHEPAKKSYVVTGVSDKTYGITAVEDAAGPVTVEWVSPPPPSRVSPPAAPRGAAGYLLSAIAALAFIALLAIWMVVKRRSRR